MKRLIVFPLFAIGLLGQSVALNFSSLPSAQGWSFVTSSECPQAESNFFSIQSVLPGPVNVLHQSLIGQVGSAGGSCGGYYQKFGALTNQPFRITVTQRTTSERVLISGQHVGISFGAQFNGRAFLIGVGGGVVTALVGPGIQLTTLYSGIDTTQFHSYALDVTPATGRFTLSIDGVEVGSGIGGNGGNPNLIFLGNASSGATAAGDYSAFTLSPGCPVTVTHYPGPPYGVDLLPTTMNATFTPTSPMSLTDAANACGISSFNFVQTVITDAHPPKDSAGTVLSVPYSDPPPPPLSPPGLPGGYFGEPYNAFPFYYTQDALNNGFTVGCTTDTPYPPFSALVETADTLRFQDCPADSELLATDPPMRFVTSLAGVRPCPAGTTGCVPDILIFYTWAWTSSFNGTTKIGGVTQRSSDFPIDPSSGRGGVTITSINGVQLPPVVPPNRVATTASGLAYSRVSQTFNGTVTLKNIGSDSISGPVQIVFFGMPTGVTLVNATGNLSGTPYRTAPGVASLAPGQSATVSVQFKNSSNATITSTPVIYSGNLN